MNLSSNTKIITASQSTSLSETILNNIQAGIVPFLIFVFFALLTILLIAIYWKKYRKRQIQSFKLVLLRVAVPVVELSGGEMSSQGKNDSREITREKIAVMEQLYATLSRIRPQTFWQRLQSFPYFTLEIAVPYNQ